MTQYSKTALWRAVQKAHPDLSEAEVEELMVRAATQERDLVLHQGLNLDQARELVNAELFPAPEETPD